jgi:hypothetical protein
MAAGLGTLKAYLSADVTGWTGGLNKALSSLTAFKAAAIGGLAATAGAMAALAIKGTKEFYRQDRQLKRIGGLLKASDSISGLTSKAIAEDAAKMSRAFAMTEDDVMKLQARMLSFPNIGKKMVGRATAGAINMAAGLGKDPASMATALARALQDPIRGITLLKRHIGAFTEGEKEAIRNAVMMNDVFKAQEVIMAKVETRFSGVAEAMVTPWERIQAAWPEVLEGIGKVVTMTVNLADNSKSVADTIRGWGKEMQLQAPGIATFGKVLWTEIKSAWNNVKIVTTHLLDWMIQSFVAVSMRIYNIFYRLGENIGIAMMRAKQHVKSVFKPGEPLPLPSYLPAIPELSDLEKAWAAQANTLTLEQELREEAIRLEKEQNEIVRKGIELHNQQQKIDVEELRRAKGKSGANVVDWAKEMNLPRGLFAKQGKQVDRPEFAPLAEYGSVEAYRLQYGRNDEILEMTEQIVINTDRTADAAEDSAEAQERMADAIEAGGDEGIDL